MHYYPCSYLHFFPSFFLTPLSIRDKRGRNFIREMHIPRERRHILLENLVLFVLHYVCFLVIFMVLWASISTYALLLSSHRVYVLDMYIFFMPCALLIAYLDDHLHCYVIILVISIRLSCIWSCCSYVSHHSHVFVSAWCLYFGCWVCTKTGHLTRSY